MGQLTGTLSQAHVTQGERAGARSQRSGGTSRQISACAQKAQFRAEYGANHPQVRRLYCLCRGIGR